MPTNITINNVTGAQPFDDYVCDSPITTCIYVSTINTVYLPYSFNILTNNEIIKLLICCLILQDILLSRLSCFYKEYPSHR